MEFLIGLGWYVIPFLVVLSILVFVHELGHYLVARYNGVGVDVFSIGFGPEVFGWNDSVGTRWKVSCLPLLTHPCCRPNCYRLVQILMQVKQNLKMILLHQ